MLEIFRKIRKEIFSSIFNKTCFCISVLCFVFVMTGGCKADAMKPKNSESLPKPKVTNMIIETPSEMDAKTAAYESVQENKKLYYIYDNNSLAVSYEFDTINLYEDREAECITKVVNPTETVEIEYTNYGSVISPFLSLIHI